MPASIHFRTDRDDDVYDLMAADSGFISPPILGWVSVYDEESDAGDVPRLVDLAVQIGGPIDCPAFVLLDHESDVLFYWLFEHGELVDEYASEPDFFGPVDDDERDALAGDPDCLLRYAVPGTTADALRAALDADLSSADRRQRLASLLGIENTQYGYADLAAYADSDETVPVLGWELFMQSPPIDDTELIVIESPHSNGHRQ